MSAKKLTKAEEKQLAKNQNISQGMKEYWAKRKAANLGGTAAVKPQKEPEVSPLKEPEVKTGSTVGQLRGAVKARPKFEPQDEIEKLLMIGEAEPSVESFGAVDRYEMSIHSILLYRASAAVSKLDKALKELQLCLRATRGEIGVELRRKAAAEGSKITDKATEESTESDDRVVDLRFRVMETEYELDMAKNKLEGLRTRTVMLAQLGGVSLGGTR
jgi:hypothetical protein